MERDEEKKESAVEQAKKFVKLIKQLDGEKQRAVLQMIRGASVLSGKERELL